MKIMTILILTVSAVFMQVSHPIALMVAILCQALFCCLMITAINATSWFSFILFLIFMGGLMVLFIYISSLASNEKFSVKLEKMGPPLSMVTSIMLVAAYWNNSQLGSSLYSNEIKLLTNMYTVNIMTPTLMTMLYLLLTLIVVVKMTSKYEGPLRNMIYK